ncbi:MAG: metallophosphoesterase [Desulfovibrionaceae bacterium]|nr:metallophosphoesterase [Desulfovibrionaceae bacterium]
MLAAGAYVSCRLLAGRQLPLWLIIALTCFILLISQTISLMRLLIISAAKIPFAWLRVGGFMACLFTTAVSLLVVRDLVLILLWIGQRMPGAAATAALAAWLNTPRADACLLGGSVLAAAFFMWRTLRVPRIREVEISMDALPHELDGLRLAQLSDLHMGSTFNGQWLREVVERTNAMQPDFVLLTGDLVDGRPAVLGEDMKALGTLKARYGVLITVGNHEYYSGLMPWVQTWRQQGLTVLLNEHRVFMINGVPLLIAGVTDPSAARFSGLSLPDPEQAKAGSPHAFSILMAHQPKDAARHAALGYTLQVSGHTHGGQYVFMFPLVSWLNRGYRSGLYEVQGMKLYVSPGTGLWGYVPMRVGSPSEISILTLTCPRPAGGDRK